MDEHAQSVDRNSPPVRRAWSAALKRVEYAVFSRLIHQPELLRRLSRFFQRRPTLSGSFMAPYKSVAAVFRREISFSNTAHRPNMPAGQFAIGMDKGPLHNRDRSFLKDVLPSPEIFAKASAKQSRQRIEHIKALPGASFNLIDEYMTSVVWSALREAFGKAAPGIETGGTHAPGECPFAALFGELRYLGAHLIVGHIAPRSVNDRAQKKARALNARVESHLASIRSAWNAKSEDDAATQRNAVGLMWVGHPATVQAGGLIMQELLDRPEIYDDLRHQAETLGDAVWSDEYFREQLRAHVLELLRFRPPFPILDRDVPRATEVDANGRNASLAAGSKLTLLTIGAMFDPAALQRPDLYWPGRPDAAFAEPEHRYLMFGLGNRSCIARHQVVETLVSALAGLLSLPRLRWAEPWHRIAYDGPIITKMQLAFGPR